MAMGMATGAILVAAVMGYAGSQTQRALRVKLADQQSVQIAGPVKIELGQAVAGGFAKTIGPQVPGTWREVKSLMGVTAVKFEPAERLAPGQTYEVRLMGLRRALTGAPIADVDVIFKAQLPPAVAGTQPSSGAKDVVTRPKLSLKLVSPNRGIFDLKASLVPEVPLKLVSSDDQTYTWEPAAALKQGTVYTFVVDNAYVSDPAKRRLATVPFTSVAQPEVTAARTGGFFAPGQTVDITFDQPMEPEDGFEFGMKGKGAWGDDRTYRFTPSELKPATSYHYAIKAGLRSKAGGVMEADRGFDFTTNGAVSGGVSPGGEVNVNTPIRIAFDQPVDHGSAESRFKISPMIAGSFSWSGTTMIFTPKGMAYQAGYSYAVAAGVVPVWGLPSAKVLSGGFSTAAEVVKLGVPAYKGQYWMACELSSLRMLLAYRGIKVDDWGILMHLNYSPRPRDTATNTWDDPNKMYVGDVNGRPNKTGYGVHAGPLAQAGREFGRNTQAYFGVGAGWISSQIHSGNPVAFYSYSDAAPRADSWNTPGGYVVQTMYPQHARVIYGVKGSAENPLGFYIHETMDGSSFYWSAAEVMNHMNAVPGVSNQAVVVF
jgi:uncharacterized protein YvpB